MASKTISAKEICLANMLLAKDFGTKFEITRPHNVKMIEKQLAQLDSAPAARRVAHLAYMINKLEPFATQNTKTAVLCAHILTVRLGGSISTDASINGMLKHDTGVDAIERLLQV